ncbi:MAG: hypothetical protein IKI50_07225 [Clostridia bacterium]|nr:hypothetical protein [Clostridia bacterium]
MAREMYLVGVPPEDLQPDPPIQQPQTPRGKLENFWYHYKWMVLLIGFLVVVFTFMTVQWLTRTEYDYHVVLVTEKAISDQARQQIAASFEAVGEDIDGDGAVRVNVEALLISSDVRLAQLSTQSRAKMLSYLASGDMLLFGLTPSYYEDLSASLSEGFRFFSDLEGAGNALDGTCFDWEGTALQQAAGAGAQHLYFGVRQAAGTAKNKAEQQQQDLRLLKAWIAQQGGDTHAQ